MFRNRVRPPTPPLDDLTAERLLRGTPGEDLPDAYQPLGRLLVKASEGENADELEGSAAAAAMFVAAHHAATVPRRRRRSVAASVLVLVAIGASTGTAVAAVQDALPLPMQQIAHEALGAVGISVPGIEPHDDTGNPSNRSGVTSDGTVDVVTPTTTPTNPASTDSSTPPRDDERSNGEGNGNEGNVPANPNAGQGNNNAGGSGNGEGNGNEGNVPANPSAGQGNNAGNNAGGNGNGNGPPEVPPGQAKK